MRRTLAALATAGGLVLSTLACAPATEAAVSTGSPRPGPDAHAAERALAVAQRLLGDQGLLTARRTAARPAEATLALRDLFLALPALGRGDRRQAHGLLARPTDGAADPQGDGYRARAKRRCSGPICMHWVRRTRDAPPSRRWVRVSLRVMHRAWHTEVGRMGYRRPVRDGRRGGDGRLDVYLKELGSKGLYGYCAPERRKPGTRRLASGYCVLDDDFARSQYGARPINSLRVTAAHEFFHAVQFAYDFREDPWLMETTATWMEERVADSVNDNRQYLPYGQLGRPGTPLDTFRQLGFNQYGNWPFFEYLSTRFGNRVVRAIWHRAGAFRGSGHQYSTRAVRAELRRHGGFLRVFRAYTAGNTVPGRTYPEGDSWPTAAPARVLRMSTQHRRAAAALSIDHLASRTVRVRPAHSLTGRGRRLRLVVDGPAARTAPAAMLVIRARGRLVRRPIRLDRDGRGHTSLAFGARRVRYASVTLVNASSRFSCWHGTSWTCRGRARDDNKRFELRAVLRR